MTTIVILTGSELRHQFLRVYLSNINEIKVLTSFCESTKGNLNEKINLTKNNSLRNKHLDYRSQSEKDFFETYTNGIIDNSNPKIIERGEINDAKYVNEIKKLNPDLLIAYGCSIIRSELLDVFIGKFINIHLGLSPYFRGSGTNFWPFVENKLSLVGTTFMHIDEGIDTGKIIHQIRAKIFSGDSIHTIGNRLIKDSVIECSKLIINFKKLNNISLKKPNSFSKVYRNKDFTEESVQMAYNKLSLKIDDYILNKESYDEQFPIIKNLV